MEDASDITGILGLDVLDPRVRRVVAWYALERDTDLLDRTHWENRAEGLTLVQEGGATIDTIFLYGPGRHEGFTAFAGALPHDLSFDATRHAVHALLGPPTRSGGPTRRRNVAEDGGWDRWDDDRRSLHVTFHPLEDRILLVTLMVPGWDAD